MKYSRILIAIGTFVLISIMISSCHGGGDKVDDLLKEKISLINQATDILYNERTPEGKEKLIKIQAAEIELEKKIAALPDAKRREFYNNPELKEAIGRLERAKEVIVTGL